MKIGMGPREKMIKCGVNSLLDFELLAILIGTGSKNEDVLSLSKRILDEYTSLDLLKDTTLEELMKFKGIGPKKAAIIITSLELYKRINNNQNKYKKISSPRDIYEYIKNDFIGLTCENLYVIFLNKDHKILSKINLFKGNLDAVSIDSREIIKRALRINSTIIALVHNHPAGSLHPSSEDIASTFEIEKKLNYFNLTLFDHLIISSNGYYSIKYDITHRL